MKYSILTLNECTEALQKIDKSIVSIKRYSQFDFKLVKKMIDKFKKSKVDNTTQMHLSQIVGDLQYIDIYYQKLTHIQLLLDKLKLKAEEELLRETQNYPFSVMIALNELQFTKASEVYISSTDNIKVKLNELSKSLTAQDDDFVSKSSLYSHNNKILDKATSIGCIYFKSLTKIFSNVSNDDFQIASALRQGLKVYTMRAERDICAEFLTNYHTVTLPELGGRRTEEACLF